MSARLFATVYEPDDLPTEEAHIASKSIGTLNESSELEVKIDLHGSGAIRVKIARHHPQAALLVKGNYLIVHGDDGPVGGGFLEEATIDLSADEGPGDEWLVWTGRGPWAVLARANLDDTSRISGGHHPIGGFWDLSAQGPAAGADNGHPIPVMKRALVEAQLNPANGIPMVDHSSWTYDADSTSAAPPFFDGRFGVHIGDDLLTIIARADQLGGVIFTMSVLFKLDAYLPDNFGANKAGAFGAETVRFEKGVNVAASIDRKVRGAVERTHLVVGGAESSYITVVDPDWVSGDEVHWGFLAVPETADPDHLEAAGLAHIAARKRQTDTFLLPQHDHGDSPAVGIYEPGPDGHYYIGTIVSHHTGNGTYDANEQASPVAAITWQLKTGEEANGDYWVIPEVGSTFGWTPGAGFIGTVPGSQHHLELCRPATLGTPPVIVATNSGNSTDPDLDVLMNVAGGMANSALYVGVYTRNVINAPVTPVTVHWRPQGTATGQQALTEIATVSEQESPDAHKLALYRLLDPTPSSGPSAVRVTTTNGRVIAGVWLLAGVDQTTPESATATNEGLSASASSLNLAYSAGQLRLDVAGWSQVNASVDEPAPTAGQAKDWGETRDQSPGLWDFAASGGHGGSNPSTSDLGASRTAWSAIGAVISGGEGTGTEFVVNDGHADLVGTSPRAARCDHRHDVHRDRAPTVNDDWATAGYKLGTIWAQLDSLETPTEIVGVWMLVDESEGAAIWLSLGTGNGGVSDHDELGNILPDDHHDEDHHSRHEPGGADAMTVDAAAETGSLRTLGTGALQASPGNHGPHVEELSDLSDVDTSGASDGEFLKLDTGVWVPTAVAPGSGMANPMTTAGDIIKGGASGDPERLAIGSNGQVLKVVSGAPAWTAESGGGGGGLFTDMDIPPASPHASNEEGDDFLAWTFVTSSGTPTASALLDASFTSDSGPGTDPLYNVDTDIASHLVMQPVAGGKLLLHRSWAPASGTDWVVAAKVRIWAPNNTNSADDRLMVGVASSTPALSGNEPANSIAAELRTSSTFYTQASLRPGVRTNATNTPWGIMYGAIVGRADNSIRIFTSHDGNDWRLRNTITSGTAPAGAGTVSHVYIYTHDLANNGMAVVGMVDWIRFGAGFSSPYKLGGGR